ncbi:MAG: hypothetical protein QE271_00720 [Bacteriovoracaceae bacterium]|nr:hypothetical protein [Bacteriovoracaceae bacterium]
MLKKIKKNKQGGQSTIEFIIAFGIILFFTTFFMTTAINFAIGYLAHFATFKAGRTYLTADNSAPDLNAFIQNAQGYARTEFQKFNFASYGIKSGSLQFNDPGLTTPIYHFVGAYFLFDPPFNRIGTFKIPIKLPFVSEAFLGKEPGRADCLCRIQTVYGYPCEGMSYSKALNDEITIEDNGC